MMTIRQYFLLKLIEECAEVAHVAAKQIQFGGEGTHPRKAEEGTNRLRLRNEINDLLAVIDILVERDEISYITSRDLEAAKDAKRAKIDRYLGQSQDLDQAEESRGIRFPEGGGSWQDQGGGSWQDQGGGSAHGVGCACSACDKGPGWV